MSALTDRIHACRALAKQAARRADRQAHYGYLAESLGLADAATGRPCDPFQVGDTQVGRYATGYGDGRTLLMLEAVALCLK